MAVHHEKEYGVSDTEVDTDLEREDHEGKTHPFTEVDRAEAAVERSRERVERSMVALRDAIARRTDWRGWMAQRPAVFLGRGRVPRFSVGLSARRGPGFEQEVRSWR